MSMGAASFAPVVVERVARAGGGFVLRGPPLSTPARCVGDWLVQHAHTAPTRIFLAERADGGWRTVSYGVALALVRSLAQALIDLGLSADKPLAIVSGNGLDHALLALAAMHVGIPVAPLSPAYSLQSKDHAKLKALIDVVGPGAVYASDATVFARALAALPPSLVRLDGAAEELARGVRPSLAVDDAFARVGPDTIAKILFTSGSTGAPKGIVNTQRMLTANQAAIVDGWPLLRARPPVVVDWLPWSHTFGGNHNFFMVLAHGGTLYIDEGKPAPGAFDATIRNLKEIPSTLYFNVPRGFDLLASALEADAQLRAVFFRDLELLFYAAAAIAPSTWQRLEAVGGRNVAMVSAWGLTETSPLATQVHQKMDRPGVIGVPASGTDLAFVPAGQKLEMRVKGPQLTPGYWRAGGAVEPVAVDELGFFATGDAGKLDDESAPEKGVVFDGRIAENFKLASGTWVHVGELRVALVSALAPLVSDAVICGHDRDCIGALVFAAPGVDVNELARKLASHNAEQASSRSIVRVLVLDEVPQIDAGEITDKGYLNQRAIRERRAADVAVLFSDDPRVIRG